MKNVFSSQAISTIANIGVIVGLAFLIMEIRQANKIAVANTEIEIRSLFSGVNEALYAVPGFDELLVKLKDEDAELFADRNRACERIRAAAHQYLAGDRNRLCERYGTA